MDHCSICGKEAQSTLYYGKCCACHKLFQAAFTQGAVPYNSVCPISLSEIQRTLVECMGHPKQMTAILSAYEQMSLLNYYNLVNTGTLEETTDCALVISSDPEDYQIAQEVAPTMREIIDKFLNSDLGHLYKDAPSTPLRFRLNGKPFRPLSLESAMPLPGMGEVPLPPYSRPDTSDFLAGNELPPWEENEDDYCSIDSVEEKIIKGTEMLYRIEHLGENRVNSPPPPDSPPFSDTASTVFSLSNRWPVDRAEQQRSGTKKPLPASYRASSIRRPETPAFEESDDARKARHELLRRLGFRNSVAASSAASSVYTCSTSGDSRPPSVASSVYSRDISGESRAPSAASSVYSASTSATSIKAPHYQRYPSRSNRRNQTARFSAASAMPTLSEAPISRNPSAAQPVCVAHPKPQRPGQAAACLGENSALPQPPPRTPDAAMGASQRSAQSSRADGRPVRSTSVRSEQQQADPTVHRRHTALLQPESIQPSHPMSRSTSVRYERPVETASRLSRSSSMNNRQVISPSPVPSPSRSFNSTPEAYAGAYPSPSPARPTPTSSPMPTSLSAPFYAPPVKLSSPAPPSLYRSASGRTVYDVYVEPMYARMRDVRPTHARTRDFEPTYARTRDVRLRETELRPSPTRERGYRDVDHHRRHFPSRESERRHREPDRHNREPERRHRDDSHHRARSPSREHRHRDDDDTTRSRHRRHRHRDGTSSPCRCHEGHHDRERSRRDRDERGERSRRPYQSPLSYFLSGSL